MRWRLTLLPFTALLLACGEPAGPYETAGLEVRSSGGDEIISREGEGLGTESSANLAAPVASRDAFQQALVAGKALRERELAQADALVRRRLLGEAAAIENKLQNLDLAFLQQRSTFALAQGAVTNFVYRYAPNREWEASYALRSGDIGLSASIVQSVLASMDAGEVAVADHVDIPQEETALEEEFETHISDIAANELRAEMLGSDALFKLAQLAIEAADFGEAERQLRACLRYESDLAVRADALNAYAALLELLGRKEDAEKVDAITSRSLNLRN